MDNIKNKKVKIFTTPICPWCMRAKQYLNDKGIEYEEIDVTQNAIVANHMVAKSGQSGVPQIWMDEHVVVGFNQSLLDQLLSS